MRVLLVDNDHSSGSSLTQAFTEENYVVNLVTDGETALKIARSQYYDLIVLNLLSKKRISIRMCEILRDSGYQGSIMLLSRQDQDHEQVECDLSRIAGSNDCLNASEDMHVVMSRIHALLN